MVEHLPSVLQDPGFHLLHLTKQKEQEEQEEEEQEKEKGEEEEEEIFPSKTPRRCLKQGTLPADCPPLSQKSSSAMPEGLGVFSSYLHSHSK